MENNCHIRAYYTREEHYQSLKFEYTGSLKLRESILKAFQIVALSTGITPGIHDSFSSNNSESLYIDFYDEYYHKGIDFITNILSELGIKSHEIQL